MTRVVRRLSRRLPSVSLALALAVMAFGASGCETYHYYDMDVTFSPDWVGGLNSAGGATLCKVIVSGADSHDFNLKNCGLTDGTKYPDVGTFEFATFADSGTLTFTINAYNGSPPGPDCLFGGGTTNMTASSQVTQMGTITVAPNGQPGCPNNP
jgi:hypothetical protein